MQPQSSLSTDISASLPVPPAPDPPATDNPFVAPDGRPVCHVPNIHRLIDARNHLEAAAELISKVGGTVDVDSLLRKLDAILQDIEDGVGNVKCGGCLEDWRHRKRGNR